MFHLVVRKQKLSAGKIDSQIFTFLILINVWHSSPREKETHFIDSNVNYSQDDFSFLVVSI